MPTVVVPDVRRALAELARYRLRPPAGCTVTGVTGSTGKTTTKDLLAQILASRAATVSSPLSHNNEIGLPLTVVNAPTGTRHLILEMGARRIGDIAHLTGIARPTIGVVTNTGTAHLGVFGSRDAIRRTKAELVRPLPADGTAVLNADDPATAAMTGLTRARVLTYGRARATGGPDLAVSQVRLDDLARPAFRLTLDGRSERVSLALHGVHQVANAAASAAAAIAAGTDLSDVARALNTARAVTPSRMCVTRLPDGPVLVNDAFNANPDSMAAALHALRAMTGPRGRSVAVLGEMYELGPESAALHRRLGRRLATAGIDRAITVGGDLAGAVAEGAALGGALVERVATPSDALNLLAGLRYGPGPGLGPADVVLVKGSRATGVEEVATRFLKEYSHG
ncbi:UDP-N-acetylmuramoyl-tripeptide--D-alanyl-D-alanine ligase [Streptomyces sp. NPDC051546]|uniref:UDP-N-acetylmuramoyl-tripeptide--D-alanyl-D- alanine ligase n=1 Tax=Streptomyces sp. NPDC051546 TaxID=3365655 RepID=UPI0037ACD316